MKTALLVGGTAATGVAIAAELERRGYAVTIYHRGAHEVDALAHLEHIHGDPHVGECIRSDLAGRSWDVTVATYGRVRLLAEELRGRTGQFVSISGTPVVAPGPGVPLAEHDGYETPEQVGPMLQRLLPRIIETEQAVLQAHRAGDFAATVVRYPYVYGPHAVVPLEWHVIQRVLDGRRHWLQHGSGLVLAGRCASPNAAALVGRVVDQPATAGGKVYHAADARQFTQREWVEMVSAVMGHRFEFVDIPVDLCPLGWSAVPMAGEYSWARARDTAAGLQRHVLVSGEAARRELGHRDEVEPAVWIRQTVEHLLAHPPSLTEGQGHLSQADFDYPSEDALLAFWQSARAEAPRFGKPMSKSHPYDHPR